MMMMSSNSSSTQHPLGLSIEELFALDRQYRRIEQQQHLQQLQQQAQVRQNTLISNLSRHTARSSDAILSNDRPSSTTARLSGTKTNIQQQRPPPLRYEQLPSLEIHGQGFRGGHHEMTTTKSSHENYTTAKPFWKDRPDYHTKPPSLQVNSSYRTQQSREEPQHYQRSHSIDQLVDYRHRDNILPSQYTTNVDPSRTLYGTRTIGSAQHQNLITTSAIDATPRILSARTSRMPSTAVSSTNFGQSNTTNSDPRNIYSNRSQWANMSSNGRLSSTPLANTMIIKEGIIPSSTSNAMSNHHPYSHFSTFIYDSPSHIYEMHGGDNRSSCKLRRQPPIKRESSRKIVVRPVIQRRRAPSLSSSCESLDEDRQVSPTKTKIQAYNSLNDRTNLENIRQSSTNDGPTTTTLDSIVSNRFSNQNQTTTRSPIQSSQNLNSEDRPLNVNNVLVNGTNTICDDVSDTENNHKSHLTDNDSEDSAIDLNLYEQRLHIGKSYDTNDISVQLEGPKIMVHCHTIEPTDKRGNYRKHEFKTEIFIPEVVDDETIVSYLTEDGILIVEGKYQPWAWEAIKKQRILEKQSQTKQSSVSLSSDLLRSSSNPVLLNNQNETNNVTRSEVDLEKKMTIVKNTRQPPASPPPPPLLPLLISKTNSNKFPTQINNNYHYFSSSSSTENKKQEKPFTMTSNVEHDQYINNSSFLVNRIESIGNNRTIIHVGLPALNTPLTTNTSTSTDDNDHTQSVKRVSDIINRFNNIATQSSSQQSSTLQQQYTNRNINNNNNQHEINDQDNFNNGEHQQQDETLTDGYHCFTYDKDRTLQLIYYFKLPFETPLDHIRVQTEHNSLKILIEQQERDDGKIIVRSTSRLCRLPKGYLYDYEQLRVLFLQENFIKIELPLQRSLTSESTTRIDQHLIAQMSKDTTVS